MRFRESGSEKLSFNDSIVSIQDFIAYLKRAEEEEGEKYAGASEAFVNKTQALIERAARLIIFSQKKRFNRESRAYQVFALDFIIDSQFKPWLIDIKNAPYFNLKNVEFLKSILDHQFELTHYRNEQLIRHLETVKSEIDVNLLNQKINIQSEEAFFRDIEHLIDFRKLRGELREILNKYPTNLNFPEQMELMYDERVRFGKKTSPGIEKERFQGKFDFYDVNESFFNDL